MSWLDRIYRANLAGLAATAAVLLLVGAVTTNSYVVTTFNFALIAAIGGVGLTLLFGLTGLASLGQAAFFGVGAYVAALLVERAGLPPLAGIVAAPLGAGLLGWLIGRPLLRLSGNYLTMASLAFGVVMYLVFSQAGSITGGLDPGFMLSREFSIGGWMLGSTKAMYWVCGVSLLLTLYLAINLVQSRVGRAWRALKSSEVAAECVGIPTVQCKSAVFAIAAGMAGLSGALYAFFMRSFNATAFGFSLSIEMLIIVIIGSMRSIWGALFGALIVTLLPAMLEHFNDYKVFVYGAVMVVIMLFLPDGLFQGAVEGLTRMWTSRRARS